MFLDNQTMKHTLHKATQLFFVFCFERSRKVKDVDDLMGFFFFFWGGNNMGKF